MSFRRRLTLASAVAVAVAVALASAVTYLVVRSELRGQVDDRLRQGAEVVAGGRILMRDALPPGEQSLAVPERLAVPADPLEGPVPYIQLVHADGTTLQPRSGAVDLPVDAKTRELAVAGEGSSLRDARVDGVHVRIYAIGVERGLALQLMRPLTETDDLLEKLAVLLGLVTLGGVGLALVLARGITTTAAAPVAQLTGAAEHVARTRDLSRRIEAEGSDELSRLAASFNTMLEALDESMRAQRQLVADASHELRTPLTSLRTNIEVLAEEEELQPDDRARLLRDVVGQLQELTLLVGDLVDLARGDEPLREREDLRLDALVEQTVERARRRHPEREFVVTVDPAIVNGVPSRIDRAVANLLDNAVKWGPPGEPVEVRVENGEVSVRDHGPGFSESDLPLVFDRFYRAPAARGLPGSGLGLAIVRQVAESHGGRASAENAPDGGARLRLRLSRNGDSAASVASAASGRT
jgi:two-component system, OmpR family, sensor histidine kinase MprB